MGADEPDPFGESFEIVPNDGISDIPMMMGNVGPNNPDLTDAERHDLLNGHKRGSETERDRIARVAGHIKAQARREGAAEVVARVEALCNEETHHLRSGFLGLVRLNDLREALRGDM